MFDELLKGESKPPQPELPQGRPDNITIFIDRDETFFQEVEILNRAVVMHCADQALKIHASQVLQIALDTKLVNEKEVSVSELTGERFLIHLPEGLAVETFVRALPERLWDEGFAFQQWSLLDDATVKMPRFKVLLDLVGLPPHQWRESSVINAVSKMGLFLGTVANERPTDLSALRVAIATDDLLKISKNITLVVGGLEYPVEVRPVTWERGPIYTAGDFPVLPKRFTRYQHPEPAQSEADSDSSGRSGLGDEELIPCSRKVLTELCQGKSQASIPPEILAFLMGKPGTPEISIGALKELVSATDDQENTAVYYAPTGHNETSQIEHTMQRTTQSTIESDHRLPVSDNPTASPNKEKTPRDSHPCMPNETRTKSVLEAAKYSVQGTVQKNDVKGKDRIPNQDQRPIETANANEAGQFHQGMPLATQEQATQRMQPTKGKQVSHGTVGNSAKQVQPFPFPTSRHNRFRDILGRGRGRSGPGSSSKSMAGHSIGIRGAATPRTTQRGSLIYRQTETTLLGEKKGGTDTCHIVQARDKYKWTREAVSIPVEVINSDGPRANMGRDAQPKDPKMILKRKPDLSILDQDLRPTQEGPSKRTTKNPNKSAKAKINLDPAAFFEVAVEKKHCRELAKGCGLSTVIVEQALREDNDERRTTMQMEIEVRETAEAENQDEPRVNLDPDSEEEFSAAEEDC